MIRVRTCRLLAVSIFLLFVLSARPAAANLTEVGRLVGTQAEWVASDGANGAFGAGDRVYLTRGVEAPRIVRDLRLADPLRDAVLVGDVLYANDGRRLLRVELTERFTGGALVTLTPEPVGRLLTARMTDFVVVAEDGFGLRFVRLPSPTDMPHSRGHDHRHATAAVQVAALPLPLTFTALAATGQTVFAGTRDLQVVAIDVGDPERPTIRRIPIRQRPVGLAANGERLLVLGSDGLRQWDLRDIEAPRELSFDPGVVGAAIDMLGRTLRVGSTEAGLRTLYDASAAAADTSVTVGDNFFSPRDVTVGVGDTVTWSKQTIGFHNVEACSPGQGAGRCGTLTATEPFRSGSATGSTFTYPYEFSQTGRHEYVCVVHAFGGVGMTGSVTVEGGGGASPPVVPDGGAGDPVTGTRLDAAGDLIRVAFDSATCSPTDHHILYGGGDGLPSVPGGAFSTLGATCDIGTGPSFDWSAPSTALDPGGLIWWLVVADDGSRNEGSWGHDANGAERNGAASSALCGMVNKNLQNTCGQ